MGMTVQALVFFRNSSQISIVLNWYTFLVGFASKDVTYFINGKHVKCQNALQILILNLRSKALTHGKKMTRVLISMGKQHTISQTKIVHIKGKLSEQDNPFHTFGI